MKRIAWISAVTTGLVFPLIALGAIVRLHGAGLACPDWPLCYGRVTPLNDVISPPPQGFRIALEVGHRYWAGTVGLLVFGLAAAAWTTFREFVSVKWLSVVAVGLLIPQAILGALTVWMKLAPITVSLHLIAGNLFFGSMILLTLQFFRAARLEEGAQRQDGLLGGRSFRLAALAALVVVAMQIWLGGWVSASGASMICPEFPSCHGEWALPGNYHEWLQMSHRLVGFLAAGVIALVSVLGLRSSRLSGKLRALSAGLTVLVVAQILLGWFNVAHYVPVPTSALHTAVAALIFGLLTYLVGRSWLPAPTRT